MRACESLDELADVVAELQRNNARAGGGEDGKAEGESPESGASIWEGSEEAPATLEAELSGKMGTLRLEDGQVRKKEDGWTRSARDGWAGGNRLG